MRIFGPHDLDEMAALARSGHVLAIPTDTVYGLGARPDQSDAVEMIYALKGRPAGLALPLLAADFDDVLSLLGELPPKAVVLARAFWPGPLTLVVPASDELARSVGAVDGTVGIRVPALGVTRRLLARSGPLAVTSANLHGEPPCKTSGEVRAVFGAHLEPIGVLESDGQVAPPSTIASVAGEVISIIREGSIGLAELTAALA